MRRLLFLLIPLALLAAACGDDNPTATADRGDQMSDGMSNDGMSNDGMSNDGMSNDGHGGNSDVADGARTITVGATSFEFDPPEIRAETDEDLAIELTSDDIEHDFTIDELDGHVAADVDETATGGFNTGGEPGTYTYYCAVPGHREAGMEGELIVE